MQGRLGGGPLEVIALLAEVLVVVHDRVGRGVPQQLGDPGHAHELDGQTIQGGVPTSPSALTDGSARGLGTSTAVATTGITLSTQTTNHTHAVTVTGTAASSGATGTDLNLPPYLGVRFIIKT